MQNINQKLYQKQRKETNIRNKYKERFDFRIFVDGELIAQLFKSLNETIELMIIIWFNKE